MALGGDVGTFHKLWVTARRAEEDLDGQSWGSHAHRAGRG
jgi:hypothetical protein